MRRCATVANTTHARTNALARLFLQLQCRRTEPQLAKGCAAGVLVRSATGVGMPETVKKTSGRV
jgi:shikimate 5-dehydrogenase